MPIPINSYISLIRLCVENNYFAFCERYYRSYLGVAMGSPLSPVLANLYVEYFNCTPLATFDFNPALLVPYVGDVFAVAEEFRLKTNFFSCIEQYSSCYLISR